MSSLVGYKGLSVLNTTVGPGGSAINTDFTTLADRIGPCNYTATTDPTTSDNTSSGYYAGSRWFNLNAGTEWVCLASSASTATWTTTTLDPAAFDPAGAAATAQSNAEASAASTYLPLAGGTMSGDIQMESHSLINFDNCSDTFMGGFQDGNLYARGNIVSDGYNLYYSNGTILADWIGTIWYGNGMSPVAAQFGSLYYLYYGNGYPLADGNSILYYGNYTTLADGSGNLYYGNGLGSILADAHGLLYPLQAPTSGAPTYKKGALYFDTTLNKLRVGGASGWETVTSS